MGGDLAIVDISTYAWLGFSDGWLGYVSMSDSGNAAEYSCTKGCTSLTGNINLSKDKTIVIDQDMDWPEIAQVQCKAACRVQLKDKRSIHENVQYVQNVQNVQNGQNGQNGW